MLRRNLFSYSTLGIVTLSCQKLFALDQQFSSNQFLNDQNSLSLIPNNHTFVTLNSSQTSLDVYQKNISTNEMEIIFSQNMDSEIFNSSRSFKKILSKTDIFDFIN